MKYLLYGFLHLPESGLRIWESQEKKRKRKIRGRLPSIRFLSSFPHPIISLSPLYHENSRISCNCQDSDFIKLLVHEKLIEISQLSPTPQEYCTVHLQVTSMLVILNQRLRQEGPDLLYWIMGLDCICLLKFCSLNLEYKPQKSSGKCLKCSRSLFIAPGTDTQYNTSLVVGDFSPH